jgi:hypothetical protein
MLRRQSVKSFLIKAFTVTKSASPVEKNPPQPQQEFTLIVFISGSYLLPSEVPRMGENTQKNGINEV